MLDAPSFGDVDVSMSMLSSSFGNPSGPAAAAPTAPPGRDLDDADPFAPLTSRTARCADGNGTFSGLFFSDDDIDIARAKAICRRCPLAAECLEGAVRRREAYGVWGGVLLIDGETARFPVRRGRPSKTARVEHVDDEVMIPEHLVA